MERSVLPCARPDGQVRSCDCVEHDSQNDRHEGHFQEKNGNFHDFCLVTQVNVAMAATSTMRCQSSILELHRVALKSGEWTLAVPRDVRIGVVGDFVMLPDCEAAPATVEEAADH